MVSIQIKRESELPSEWIAALYDLYHEVFVAESATAEAWIETPDWRALVLDDTRESSPDLSGWRSTLEIHQREIQVNGSALVVGGIGGVLTLPAYRGQGHAERALRRALLFITDELRLSYAMLFCFPPVTPFYERLGWLRLNAELVYRDRTGAPRTLTDGMGAMVFAAGGQPFPPGLVDLGGYPW